MYSERWSNSRHITPIPEDDLLVVDPTITQERPNNTMDDDIFETLLPRSAGDIGIELIDHITTESQPEKRQEAISTWKKWAEDYKLAIVITSSSSIAVTVLIGVGWALRHLEGKKGVDFSDYSENK